MDRVILPLLPGASAAIAWKLRVTTLWCVGEPWGKGPASPILREQLETMCCPWLHKTSQSCCLLLWVKVPWQRK